MLLERFTRQWASDFTSFRNSSPFNLFVPNAPLIYPLKTSENRKVFWCFQGVEQGWIGNRWVNLFQANVPHNTKTVSWLATCLWYIHWLFRRVRFNDSWFVFHDYSWSFHEPYFNGKHIFHKSYRVNRI